MFDEFGGQEDKSSSELDSLSLSKRIWLKDFGKDGSCHRLDQ